MNSYIDHLIKEKVYSIRICYQKSLLPSSLLLELNIDRRKSPGWLNSIISSGDVYHQICSTKHSFKSRQITSMEEDCRCSMNDGEIRNVYCKKNNLEWNCIGYETLRSSIDHDHALQIFHISLYYWKQKIVIRNLQIPIFSLLNCTLH